MLINIKHQNNTKCNFVNISEKLIKIERTKYELLPTKKFHLQNQKIIHFASIQKTHSFLKTFTRR